MRHLSGARASWFNLTVLASGVVPHVVYWGGGAVFGVVAIVRLAHGDSAPSSDHIMQTHDGWPPVILPSWPFWVSAPALVVGVAQSLRARHGSPVTSFQPWLVSSFALFAGADGLLMSLAFLDTPEWPRDSAIPGAVLTAVGGAGLGAVVLRHAQGRRRARLAADIPEMSAKRRSR